MELKTKFSGNSTDVNVFGTNQFRTTKFNDYFTWNHLEYVLRKILDFNIFFLVHVPIMLL